MIKPLRFLLLFTTRSFSRISPSVQLYFSLYFCSPKSQLFGWRLRKLVGGNVVYVSEHILFSSFSIDKAPTTYCIIHLSIHQTSSDYIIFGFLCWDCKDHTHKKSGVRNFPHEKSEYRYRKYNYKNGMRTLNKYVVLKL